MWCIQSIKGWFTHPQICWQEYVKWTYRTQKKFGLICFPRICFRGLIYCDQEPLWLLNDRTCLLFFGCQLVYSVRMYNLSGTSRLIFCVMYVLWKKIFFLHWLTPVFLSMIFSSDQDWPPWVLNDGQFSRGPHCWWNSTINQLLSPCRAVDAGEKVSLNIRNLESWLFIGCRLWMIMILNHSSSGLNPNPLLLLQLLILMNTFFTPWTPAELLELPF